MSRLVSYGVVACLVAVSMLIGGTLQPLHAQETLQNSSIFGTITDASGSAIPGATVEVTGPALQTPMNSTTDDSGSYRISNVPAGTYRITYTKAGFQTENRTGFILTAGFAARVDVSLQVGATTQTVEVTAQAPVIDTSTTVTSTDLGRPTLDSVPTTRSIFQAVYMAPGIRPSATPDVGGNQLGQQQSVGSYGFGGNMTTLVDGMNALQSNSINGGDSPGDFVDFDSLEELRVISTGADADIGPAGTVMITIMKSGGNQFHGDAHGMGEPHWFQLTNLPSTVQGGSGANQLQYDWDAFGDLGGPIKKDKLWGYFGYHLQRRSEAVFGYKGKTGAQGYDPIHDDNIEGKLTYQATKNLKFIGAYADGSKIEPQRAGSPTIAYGSTYNYEINQFHTAKGEITWTPSAKWLFDVQGGNYWQPFGYPNQAGTEVAGNPWTVNQTTGNTTGPMINVSSSDLGSHDRRQISGSASYYPNGKHSFQFGNTDYFPQADVKHFNDHPAGDYELLTQTVAGVIVPYQIDTFNFPLSAIGKERAIGVYGKDVWRVTSRLTLNYGARFDNYLTYHDKETEPTGPFSLGGAFPYQEDVNWKRVTPRVGVAYDLFGDGKTIIRASYGMYNIDQLGAFDISNYNGAAVFMSNYYWGPVPCSPAGVGTCGTNGKVIGSGDTCQATAFTTCAPSAAFLSAIEASIANPTATTFNGASIYNSTTGGVAGIVNPGLRMPYFHTISATLERAIGSSMSIRGLYVANIEEDMFDLVFPNRPISDYTQSYVTTYPSTDPVNAGKPITILYYPTSDKGGAFEKTEFVNRDGHPDYFQTFEVTLTKRKTGKWSALGTFDLTKNHQWLPTTTPAIFAGGESADLPVAPYQAAFPLNSTWDWAFKSYFTYDLPFRVTFGINYQLLAGAPNYNTDQFNSVPTLGTVYIPVNQFGTVRAPEINVMNLRLGRIFPIKEHDTLEFTLELFNALNVAPGTTVNYINGAPGTSKAPGFTSVYMDPMIGRFGAQFKF